MTEAVIGNAGPQLADLLPDDPEPYQTFFPGVLDIVDAALARHGFLSEVPLEAAA